MKLKLGLLLSVFMFTTAASANIYCFGKKGLETVEIDIYDTLIGISTKVTRKNPMIEDKTDEFFVSFLEQDNTVSFYSKEENFNLVLNKVPNKPGSNPKYEAAFSFKSFMTQVTCESAN